MTNNSITRDYYNHSTDMHFNDHKDGMDGRERSTPSADDHGAGVMMKDDGSYGNNDRSTPRSEGGEGHREHDDDDSEKQQRTRTPMTPNHNMSGRDFSTYSSSSSSPPPTISMIMLSPNNYHRRPSFEDINEAYHHEVSTMSLGVGAPTEASNLGEESPRMCEKRGRFLVWPSSVMFDEVSSPM